MYMGDGKVIRYIKIFSMTLSVFFMAISSSFALDEEANPPVFAKIFLEYDGIHGEKNMEKTGPAFSTDYSSLLAERSFLHEDKKESFTGGFMNVTGVPFTSYMTVQNTPPSLVNNITFTVSRERKAKDLKSFVNDFGMPKNLNGFVQAGVAFLTNLATHEVGHVVVADYVGASGMRLNFFESEGISFFLGTSNVEKIDDESKLPYAMGGEFFATLTFEHALKYYRKNPTAYNKSLLFSSGTDFLWYCFYAFYISEDNPSHDPITISKETGISKDMLFSIALAKTALNAYRMYSGEDRIIPFFSVDRSSASLVLMMPF